MNLSKTTFVEYAPWVSIETLQTLPSGTFLKLPAPFSKLMETGTSLPNLNGKSLFNLLSSLSSSKHLS